MTRTQWQILWTLFCWGPLVVWYILHRRETREEASKRIKEEED